MYNTIRLIVLVVMIVAAILILRKTKPKNTRLTYIITVAAVLLFSLIITEVPFENLFVRFSTPEKAYQYLENGMLECKTEGEKSTLVISYENNKKHTTKTVILPKDAKGWKLGTEWSSKILYSKNFDKGLIEVLKLKGSDDYYVIVFDYSSKQSVEVTDSENSEFAVTIRNDDNNDPERFTYCAYVKDMKDDYKLNVDGEQISLFSDN